MDDKFYNRDFEQFVKNNADQYRMFPSEKVWKNIHHNLHTRSKWYGIGIGLLLLSIGAVTGVMVSNPSSKHLVANAISKRPINTSAAVASQNQIPFKVESKPEEVANPSIAKFGTPEIFQNNPFSNTSSENELNEDAVAIQFTNSILPALQTIISSAGIAIYMDKDLPDVAIKMPVIAKKQIETTPAAASILFTEPVSTSSNKEDLADKATQAKQPETTVAKEENGYPLTIESVVNSYQYRKSRKKLRWEMFVTPTVTYRRLSENKDFINASQAVSNSLSYTAFTDINSLVKHKPDIGLQFGVTTAYPLFKNLNIVGGFQFNVSKYDIRAFYSNSEIATIALNTGAGANSVSTTTNYRNFSSGNDVNWLRNFYFSASIPVGLDLKIAQKGKSTIGIIGTVQPTYILSDQAYLITTDYKNYAEMPSLIRKFNVNTGLELYTTFSAGKTKWKIGPQARYQTRSSFKAPYPVKEHLFDFGIKLGVTIH